ncbi:MAG: helix-turn-helix domain-containing protein [Candidatus Thorarchaeota archaeon]|jgi:predicted DNA binding protein
MIEAKIEVIAEAYPVRVNLISINGPLGFGIIQSLTGDEDPLVKYVKALENSSSISEVRITHKSPEVYWSEVVHKMNTKSIHETILESGCMSRLPIIIEHGRQVHQLLAPDQTAFRIAFDNLRENFKKVKLLRVHRSPKGSPSSGLTTKQLGAMREAINSGYYDIPRKCEVKQIAKQLGIKRVATQERMRRAERIIMNQFADEYL